MSRTVLAMCLAVAAACTDGGSQKPASESKPDEATERAARWSATSPPPTRACGGDGDCGVFAVAPGDDPCCDVTVTAAPLSVHFMRANAEWRKANCAGVTCPPLDLPGAQPASCAFVPRCDRGTCASSCDQVPDPTPRSAMPADSPGRLECKADDDCVVMGLAPSAKNPCCDGSPIPAPVSRRYLEAVQMWRPLGCKDVQCPPHDTSTFQLGECAMEARCVRGACQDRCAK